MHSSQVKSIGLVVLIVLELFFPLSSLDKVLATENDTQIYNTNDISIDREKD